MSEDSNYRNVQELLILRRQLRSDLELIELNGAAIVLEDFFKTIQRIEALWSEPTPNKE